MKLFHQLTEEDQYNAVHYCMHNVVDDMLSDGVEMEAFSDEDKRRREILTKVVAEAQELPEEQQLDHIAHHSEAWQICFDIALDMARGAYYHPSEDMVIYYEELRDNEHENNEDETVQQIEAMPEFNIPVNKKKVLN